jgi:8-oxo-dGTP diphosphatase
MSDAEYLANYNPNDYPRPAVTVDIVVFTIFDGELNVLLIERKVPPFTGRLALLAGSYESAMV